MSPKSSVTVTKQDAVAVILVNRPPVNAVDASVRLGLMTAIREAESDGDVAAIVVAAVGTTFIAGADLSELGTGIAEPSYGATLAAIENCSKPVIAVLHGTALGAGVEVALACHYRIALEGVKIGLPEITLGIVPGAGGTQRLPRLIGVTAALDLLLTGKTIGAGEALGLGLIDAIGKGTPVSAGIDYVRAAILTASPSPIHRNRQREFDEPAVSKQLNGLEKQLRGRTTQFAMVDAVKASVTLPVDEGFLVERKLSDASLATHESLALRHLFFAERATTKVPGIPNTLKPSTVRNVTVVGAGTMGSGIAMAFGDAGYQVTLVDANADGLERGKKLIRSTYEANVRRGRMTSDEADKAVAQIVPSLDMGAASDADLVVEAVFEDLDVKKNVLGQLDKIVSPHTIIATNTSSLSVTELGAATGRPEKVIGLHFFSPAHVMKLLEIVRGNSTSPETLATGLEVGKRIRKIPVVSGDGFGFIGNRMMLDGAFREAEQMMLEGASVEQIDQAVESFGFAMGPSRVNDMAGVDIGTHVRQQLARREPRTDPYCVVSDTLTPLGRVGQKVLKGFYSYADDPRKGAVDPIVGDIIERLAAERGIARRALSDEEIIERFVLQLVNIGADILDEGIAYRSADIDVVWVHGYGFPRHVGGPMFYADSLGLNDVADRIRYWHEQKGRYWKPAALLERLAADGATFSDYDRRIG